MNGNEVDESSDISSIPFDPSSGIATLELENPIPDGTYQLTVHGAGITDQAGNLLLKGADYTQTLVLATPDLQVTGVSGPTTGINSQTALVTWTDQNEGPRRPRGLGGQRLCRDGCQGDEPTLLGSFTFAGTLAAGASVQRTQQVSLPRVAGSYWFMVVTNATQTVPEGRELRQ